MNFKYFMQAPTKWTFEQQQLKQWVESFCYGRILNLFAGKVKLAVPEIRVDINDEFKPDFCMDAHEFVKQTIGTKQKFETIIFDPPYNLRKAREKYYGNYLGKLRRLKTDLLNIIPLRGRIISLGYDSVGMSAYRGFKKIAICLVCHGGDHNDTIGLVEERIRLDLFDPKTKPRDGSEEKMKRRKIPGAFHPGEYLREELEERKWRVDELAEKMDAFPSAIEGVISKQRPISLAFAERLGEVLGTGAEVWLNLQTVYDLTKEIRSARRKR